ncbi:MAG: Sulfite reductase [NADPH] flavoprotein alpha-component [Chlamydiia bacterium]|nr:Sulfite reductase [NADPH] flavoprotein alpha-component [Chlamydiia bacterium]
MSTIIYNKTAKSKEKPVYNHSFPFIARVKKRVLLNKSSSTKKTFHIELDLKGSQISFKEGDAVAILPKNPKKFVDETLAYLAGENDTEIRHERSDASYPLEEFVTKHANLLKVTPKLLKLLDKESSNQELKELIKDENKTLRKEFVNAHDITTCLKHFKISNIDPELFCNTLSPQLPRFYSVASSQKLHPDVVHILVATFSYEKQSELREGIGSDFLCYQTKESECEVPLYFQSNHNFFLPEDRSTPVIMIGPGTGVAAFRSFIQERVSCKEKTSNWLFFGERNKDLDYYYEEEFNSYVEKGLLRIDAAFSRDQKEKIYVQHLMLKHSKEIMQWITDGACLYVCGDARHMAKDVNLALLQILQTEGNLNEEEAKKKLLALRKEKRYQTDVY